MLETVGAAWDQWKLVTATVDSRIKNRPRSTRENKALDLIQTRLLINGDWNEELQNKRNNVNTKVQLIEPILQKIEETVPKKQKRNNSQTNKEKSKKSKKSKIESSSGTETDSDVEVGNDQAVDENSEMLAGNKLETDHITSGVRGYLEHRSHKKESHRFKWNDKIKEKLFTELKGLFKDSIQIYALDCIDWFTQAVDYGFGLKHKQISLVLSDCTEKILTEQETITFTRSLCSSGVLSDTASIAMMTPPQMYGFWSQEFKKNNYFLDAPVNIILDPECIPKQTKTQLRLTLFNAVTTVFVAHKYNSYYQDKSTHDRLCEEYGPNVNVLTKARELVRTEKLGYFSSNQNNSNNNTSNNDTTSATSSDNNNTTTTSSQIKVSESDLPEKSDDYYRPFILRYTKPEQWVLDPYGGAMRCALSCIEAGRKCTVIEKDKTLADKAEARLFHTWMVKYENAWGINLKADFPLEEYACKICGVTDTVKSADWFPFNKDFCSEECSKVFDEFKQKQCKYPLPGYIMKLAGATKQFEAIARQDLYNMQGYKDPISTTQTATLDQIKEACAIECAYWGDKIAIVTQEKMGLGIISKSHFLKNDIIAPVWGVLLEKKLQTEVLSRQREFNQNNWNNNGFEMIVQKPVNTQDLDLDSGLEIHDLCVSARFNSCNNVSGEYVMPNCKLELHPILKQKKHKKWYTEHKLVPPVSYVISALQDISPQESLVFDYSYFDFETRQFIGNKFKDSDNEDENESEEDEYVEKNANHKSKREKLTEEEEDDKSENIESSNNHHSKIPAKVKANISSNSNLYIDATEYDSESGDIEISSEDIERKSDAPLNTNHQRTTRSNAKSSSSVNSKRIKA